MKDSVVDDFGVVTREFATSFEHAFLFISDPTNLPKWTVLFKEASQSHAVLEMPNGEQKFGLKTHASYENGIIDWFIISDNGRQVDTSYSRLYRLSSGHCVYSFMFLLAPQPGEVPCAALVRQTSLIEKELDRLKAILGADN